MVTICWLSTTEQLSDCSLYFQSQGGSTALMYACEAREEYASVVEVLLLHHARVDISGQVISEDSFLYTS